MKKATEANGFQVDNFYKFFRITLVLFLIGLPMMIKENYDIVSWHVENLAQRMSLSFDSRVWQISKDDVVRVDISPQIPGLDNVFKDNGANLDEFIGAYDLATLKVIEEGGFERLDIPHLTFKLQTKKSVFYIHLFVPIPMMKVAFIAKGEGASQEIYEANADALLNVVTKMIKGSEIDEDTKTILVEKGLRQ
jgi:hypothetical protein